MATDNIHARKEEKNRINVHDPIELRYWSNRYGVTQQYVMEAVRSEGDSREAVERYISRVRPHLRRGY